MSHLDPMMCKMIPYDQHNPRNLSDNLKANTEYP